MMHEKNRVKQKMKTDLDDQRLVLVGDVGEVGNLLAGVGGRGHLVLRSSKGQTEDEYKATFRKSVLISVISAHFVIFITLLLRKL